MRVSIRAARGWTAISSAGSPCGPGDLADPRRNPNFYSHKNQRAQVHAGGKGGPLQDHSGGRSGSHAFRSLIELD